MPESYETLKRRLAAATVACPDGPPDYLGQPFNHAEVLTVVGRHFGDPNGQPEYGPHGPCHGSGRVLRWPSLSRECEYLHDMNLGEEGARLCGHCSNMWNQPPGRVPGVTLESVFQVPEFIGVQRYVDTYLAWAESSHGKIAEHGDTPLAAAIYVLDKIL